MKGAERGSGRGPWIMHINFRLDLFVLADGRDGLSSRYAEPEAEGTRPVCRTSESSQWSSLGMRLSRGVAIPTYFPHFARKPCPIAHRRDCRSPSIGEYWRCSRPSRTVDPSFVR